MVLNFCVRLYVTSRIENKIGKSLTHCIILKGSELSMTASTFFGAVFISFKLEADAEQPAKTKTNTNSNPPTNHFIQHLFWFCLNSEFSDICELN